MRWHQTVPPILRREFVVALEDIGLEYSVRRGAIRAPLTAPNVLDRDFSAEAPNSKWVADITYRVAAGPLQVHPLPQLVLPP